MDLIQPWLDPWLTRWLAKVLQWPEQCEDARVSARTLDGLHFGYDGSSLRIRPSKLGQTLQFVKYSGSNNGVVKAGFSDSQTRINVTFAAQTVQGHEKKTGRRFTEELGGVFQLLEYELIATTSGPRADQVSLLVKDFKFIGAAGAAQKGRMPRAIEDLSETKRLLVQVDEQRKKWEQAPLPEESERPVVEDAETRRESVAAMASQVPPLAFMKQVPLHQPLASQALSSVGPVTNDFRQNGRSSLGYSERHDDKVGNLSSAELVRRYRAGMKSASSDVASDAVLAVNDSPGAKPDAERPLNKNGDDSLASNIRHHQSSAADDTRRSKVVDEATPSNGEGDISPRSTASNVAPAGSAGSVGPFSRHKSEVQVNRTRRDRIKFRDIRISADQEHLLSNTDCWIPAEPGRRKPVANVPIKILETFNAEADEAARQVLNDSPRLPKISSRQQSFQSPQASSSATSEESIPWSSSPSREAHTDSDMPADSSPVTADRSVVRFGRRGEAEGTNSLKASPSKLKDVKSSISSPESSPQQLDSASSGELPSTKDGSNQISHWEHYATIGGFTPVNAMPSAAHVVSDTKIERPSPSSPERHKMLTINGSQKSLGSIDDDKQQQSNKSAIGSLPSPESSGSDVEMLLSQENVALHVNESIKPSWNSQMSEILAKSPLSSSGPTADVRQPESPKAMALPSNGQGISSIDQRSPEDVADVNNADPQGILSSDIERATAISAPNDVLFSTTGFRPAGTKRKEPEQESHKCNKKPKYTDYLPEPLTQDENRSLYDLANCIRRESFPPHKSNLPTPLATSPLSLNLPTGPARSPTTSKPPSIQAPSSSLEQYTCSDTQVKATPEKKENRGADQRVSAEDPSSQENESSPRAVKGGEDRMKGKELMLPHELPPDHDMTNKYEDAPSLYSRFKSAYPDYHGDLKHFQTLASKIFRLREQDKVMPSFLWDDFIIRHRMDYSQYLQACLDNGADLLPYEAFYVSRVEGPKFSKRVVLSDNLDEACADRTILERRRSRKGPSAPTHKDVPRPQLATSIDLTQPEPSTDRAKLPPSAIFSTSCEPHASNKGRSLPRTTTEASSTAQAQELQGPSRSQLSAKYAGNRYKAQFAFQADQSRNASAKVSLESNDNKKRRSLPWTTAELPSTAQAQRPPSTPTDASSDPSGRNNRRSLPWTATEVRTTPPSIGAKPIMQTKHVELSVGQSEFAETVSDDRKASEDLKNLEKKGGMAEGIEIFKLLMRQCNTITPAKGNSWASPEDVKRGAATHRQATRLLKDLKGLDLNKPRGD